jgi:DUF438 domain-containing protein
MELTYADDNNQFIYYNKALATEEMLAPRRPGQVGDPMSNVHPPRAVKHVKQVIHALREGQTDLVSMPVPGNGPTRHIMHYYKAMHDENGKYRGVNEWVLDLWPIVEAYLQQTGQSLVANPEAKVDATTSASKKTEASEKPTMPETDANTSASKH